MIKALIFDLDGTLVSNMSIHRKAWIEFAKRHGVDFSEEEYKNKFQGRSNKYIMPGVFGKSFSAAEIQDLADEKEALYRQLYTQVRAARGVGQLIDRAIEKGLKLAVATTAPEKNREYVLSKLGLKEKLDAVTGDEEVRESKPDPEIYLLTAKKLGVRPEECLVFEDSLPGITAAKAAGMKVIGLTTTYNEEQMREADKTINDFTYIELDKIDD